MARLGKGSLHPPCPYIAPGRTLQLSHPTVTFILQHVGSRATASNQKMTRHTKRVWQSTSQGEGGSLHRSLRSSTSMKNWGSRPTCIRPNPQRGTVGTRIFEPRRLTFTLTEGTNINKLWKTWFARISGSGLPPSSPAWRMFRIDGEGPRRQRLW